MSEYQEHVTVCNWLSTFHPNIIFFSSGDGLKLHPKTAIDFSKLKSCRGIPDIFIPEPNKNHSGIFIEMKNIGISIYQKRDTKKFTSRTIEQQNITMKRLEKKGYFCCFAIGSDAAIDVIEKYLNNEF